MTHPLLTYADRLRAGEATFTAWTALGSPASAEVLAREAFDSVTFDMQHSLNDANSVIQGISLAALAGKPSLVRIALEDFSFASRALDYGAVGVIAPMINSAADARRLVAATKYPPLGERSWGPIRSLPLFGLEAPAYLSIANRATVAVAMIETQAALDNLEAILAVEGIDGVFVGPSDLSIALFKGSRIDQLAPEVDAALKHVVARAKAHGKFAMAFTASGARAAEHARMGYVMMSVAYEVLLLQKGARAELAAAQAASGKGPVTY
ncbi:MAG TPA: aldolase/citrate lyase family protein [Beijerinckiaceae bacterium]|nr:aldolase/citrate lyase family protein [Beijerinckiaceae bacterium]